MSNQLEKKENNNISPELLPEGKTSWTRWTRERWTQIGIFGAVSLIALATLLGTDSVASYRDLPGKPTATPANIGGPIENPKSNSMVEKTRESLEDSYQDIQTIYSLRKTWYGNRNTIPTPALGKIFEPVEKYQAKLQELYISGQQNSPEAIKLAVEIDTYLNTAPGKNRTVKPPKIVTFNSTDPSLDDQETRSVKNKIQQLLDLLPDKGGRIAELIVVAKRQDLPTWNHMAGMFSFPDHPAHIYIFTTPDPEGEEKWSDVRFFRTITHELLGHAASLNSEGDNLEFLTPKEIINFVKRDTEIWTKKYQLIGPKIIWSTSEEEENAFFVGDRLTKSENLGNSNPSSIELQKMRAEFFNDYLSTLLGSPVDLPVIGKKLGLY